MHKVFSREEVTYKQHIIADHYFSICFKLFPGNDHIAKREHPVLGKLIQRESTWDQHAFPVSPFIHYVTLYLYNFSHVVTVRTTEAKKVSQPET